MSRRYAEGTDVPVLQSQGEVQTMLRKVGVGKIANMDDPTTGTVLMFEHGSRAYRLTVPFNPKAKNANQEHRRVWRLMVLLVKAKTSAIAENVTTVEREFFADTVMPSGKVLVDEAREAINHAQAVRAPLQLGWGGSS